MPTLLSYWLFFTIWTLIILHRYERLLMVLPSSRKGKFFVCYKLFSCVMTFVIVALNVFFFYYQLQHRHDFASTASYIGNNPIVLVLYYVVNFLVVFQSISLGCVSSVSKLSISQFLNSSMHLVHFAVLHRHAACYYSQPKASISCCGCSQQPEGQKWRH